MGFPNTQRTAAALNPAMREIVHIRPLVDIASATSDLPTPTGAWMGDAAQLCAAALKNFAASCRERAVISNFLRRAPGPLPDRPRGLRFENKHFDIPIGENSACKLVCERGPKDPLRNRYTSVPTMIARRLPDLAIRRMKLFHGAAFADHDHALEILLSYMSLVASSAMLPEVMIFRTPSGMGQELATIRFDGRIMGGGSFSRPAFYLTDARGVAEAGSSLQKNEAAICGGK